MLEGAISIWKASVISSKEHRHGKRRTVASAVAIFREDSFQHLERPSRIVAAVPSHHHIDLITIKQMKIEKYTSYRAPKISPIQDQQFTKMRKIRLGVVLVSGSSGMIQDLPCERNDGQERRPSPHQQKKIL